jgi:ATP-dependent RNA helicase SUPV3L1/SUV3
VRLIGEFGAEPQRERAARRLEAFVAAEATRRLSALKHLKEAIEDGLKGLARGLAYQLVDEFGVLDRRGADQRIRLLSRNERRTLKQLGVRFGAFSLYLPSLLEPQAQLLAFAYAELASSSWRPDPGTLNPLPRPAPRPQALALRGLRAVGQLAAPIVELERLDALARAAWPGGAGAIDVTDALLADLGWQRDDAYHILRALGFARVREGAERAVFRRRRDASDEPAPKAGPVATPFAALAALTKPNAAAKRRARRAKARRSRAAGRAAS